MGGEIRLIHLLRDEEELEVFVANTFNNHCSFILVLKEIEAVSSVIW
jgi:hypothetical protein